MSSLPVEQEARLWIDSLEIFDIDQFSMDESLSISSFNDSIRSLTYWFHFWKNYCSKIMNRKFSIRNAVCSYISWYKVKKFGLFFNKLKEKVITNKKIIKTISIIRYKIKIKLVKLCLLYWRLRTKVRRNIKFIVFTRILFSSKITKALKIIKNKKLFEIFYKWKNIIGLMKGFFFVII
jgi:hypothetical protein